MLCQIRMLTSLEKRCGRCRLPLSLPSQHRQMELPGPRLPLGADPGVRGGPAVKTLHPPDSEGGCSEPTELQHALPAGPLPPGP